jgi:hypothetical protein
MKNESMADTISCPYCNAILPADAVGAAPTPTCPRCGELLPPHLAEAIQSRPSAGSLATAPCATPQAAIRPSRRSLRRVAGIVVGIMGVMAILSFTYAWHTVNWRRSRDPKPGKALATQPAPMPRPVEWAALGYLPPETAIIAGLHVAEAEKTPRGKELLQSPRIGPIPISSTDIENWTGLKITDIDHAVIGLKVEPRIPPAMVLVVRSRQPIDQTKVRAALKSERGSEIGKKKVWHYNVRISSKLSLEGLLWFASSDLLVVSFSKLDMEKVPDQPASGATQIPTLLRDAIRDRVNPGSQAWLAGRVENWDGVTPLLSLAMNKETLETLSSLRTFGFGVQVASGIRLEGAVQGVDEAATERLKMRWTVMAVPEGAKELEPYFRELAKSYQREVEDGWLMIRAEAKEQVPANP